MSAVGTRARRCVILGRAVTEWTPVLWLEKARGQELDLESEVLAGALGERELKSDVIRDEKLCPFVVPD